MIARCLIQTAATPSYEATRVAKPRTRAERDPLHFAASAPRSGVGVHSTLSESSWHPQGGYDHNCMLVTLGGSDHALQIEVQALLAEPQSVSERSYGTPFRLLRRS